MQLFTLNARSRRYVWDDVWRSDRYANSWERYQRATKRFAAFKLTEILGGGERILDLGCGSGEFLNLLASKRSDFSLVGIDRSIAALGLARRRSSSQPAILVRADAKQLPFEPRQFDIVVLFGLLEHVQSYHDLLAEIHRVMKAGGLALISTSNLLSFLQLKNCLIAAAGCYPYGFQRNWSDLELEQEFEKLFEVRSKFVLHADSDMPVISLLDRLGARVNSRWGRYLCFVLTKRGAT
jgi:SAM-dependent methyltransferase